AAGTADEEQRASRSNLVRGVSRDFDRQQEMSIDVAARLLDVEFPERRVIGAGARDQHVVDRGGQLVEELPEPPQVGGGEGDGAGPELEPDTLEALRVARGEDHFGAGVAGAAGRLEADAGAAPDHDDRLPGELRLTVHVVTSFHRWNSECGRLLAGFLV